MNEIEYVINLRAKYKNGKSATFRRSMFFPYLIPLGYKISFRDFSVTIDNATIYEGCVIVRRVSGDYDADELLSEGFVENDLWGNK